MRKEAENSEFWMGMTDKENLKCARIFIQNLEMLTDLCVYDAERVVDIKDEKKKKDIEEDLEDNEEEPEFMNLTELL